MTKYLKKFKIPLLSKKYLINLEEIKSTLKEFRTNPYIYIVVRKLTEVEFNNIFEFLDKNYWISLPQQTSVVYGIQLIVSSNTENSQFDIIGRDQLFEAFKSYGCIEHD
ncbi:hypothetical protein FDH01_gp145 [Acinetobacter phage vB_AbaM_ME3]|uniref:Uncharacterized protein n=1 Tax=Acinetobacter phage vB_AbaM_ME3 TaxID=1837876 RepID=A0A172Q0W3_9CAUD|nr:hypothetical protein FDH01_gp145 [Acinetobacter phage vB_AbaM_ME3]AND75477.1 hypothetical protein ME3_316 [Acinetobacter phage vB_AbaM_ME3]